MKNALTIDEALDLIEHYKTNAEAFSLLESQLNNHIDALIPIPFESDTYIGGDYMMKIRNSELGYRGYMEQSKVEKFEIAVLFKGNNTGKNKWLPIYGLPAGDSGNS